MIVKSDLSDLSSSSFAVDHLRSLSPHDGVNVGVGYIYFERQESQQQGSDQVMRSLLRQLAQQNHHVFQYLEDLFKKERNRLSILSTKTLDSAIVFAINHFPRIYFILDALDECDEVTVRRPLLVSLSKFERAGARILLTSQPHPEDIRIRLSTAIHFEVKAFDDDIIAYIDDFVESNPRAHRSFPGERKLEILHKLIVCADGMLVSTKTYHCLRLMSIAGFYRSLSSSNIYLNNRRLVTSLKNCIISKITFLQREYLTRFTTERLTRCKLSIISEEMWLKGSLAG